MKILAIADLHRAIPFTPPRCDLVVIAGDCTDGNVSEQEQWWQDLGWPWMRLLVARGSEVVYIAGNHDWYLQHLWKYSKRPLEIQGVHYLMDEVKTIKGLTFMGTPWTPLFGGWAFMKSEDGMEKVWREALGDVRPDIIVSHGPPYGACDAADGRYAPEARAGSPALRALVERVNPKLVICGHIHEARGVATVGATRVHNVSMRDAMYHPYAEPWTEIVLEGKPGTP